MAIKTWVDGEVLYAADLNNNFTATVKGSGDGSDGAFSESSGNTALTGGTIYQYTTFSLTGTATISYTGTTQEPVVILIQGDCTISSSGTCDFCGKVTTTPTLTTTTILNVDDVRYTITSNTDGDDGNELGSGSYPTMQGNPPTYQDMIRGGTLSQLSNCPMYIQGGTTGGVGDVGGTGSPTGGTGGAGGAALMIIVGGDTAISNVTFDMTGANGGAGGAGASGSMAHGGGGGGSGVIAIFSYGTLTDSGTYSTAATTGGAGIETGSYSGSEISSGSGGASMVTKGVAGLYSANTAQTGGVGGAGFSVRKKLL